MLLYFGAGFMFVKDINQTCAHKWHDTDIDKVLLRNVRHVVHRTCWTCIMVRFFCSPLYFIKFVRKMQHNTSYIIIQIEIEFNWEEWILAHGHASFFAKQGHRHVATLGTCWYEIYKYRSYEFRWKYKVLLLINMFILLLRSIKTDILNHTSLG